MRYSVSINEIIIGILREINRKKHICNVIYGILNLLGFRQESEELLMF